MILSHKPADLVDDHEKNTSLTKARILGIVLAIGAPLATMASVLISFRYSMFTICTSIVIIGGEAPYLLSLCPAGQKCHQWTDRIFGATEKAYVYSLFSFIGVCLFFTMSWNLMLLVVHVTLGLLGFLYYHARHDFDKIPPSAFV